MRILTYSMMSSFLSCRKLYHYRYEQLLVPTEKQETLSFGSVVHTGLEFWFKYFNLNGAFHEMETRAEALGMDAQELAKATVLVEKYTKLYAQEPFDVEAVEYEFCVPLVNPRTKRYSQTFSLSGKVDGLVRMNGELYILEHKTTSAIDDAYIGRILIDSQISIYANAISKVFNEPVVGAIYDILVKPKIRLKKGESEEEFEARKAELLAKSKTGKTKAERKMPETLEEFRARLDEEITADNFRREIIKFTEEDLREHLAEVWDIGKALIHPVIFRNTGNCSRYGRPCPYLPLCREHGCLSHCEGLFETKAAHEELSIGDEQ